MITQCKWTPEEQERMVREEAVRLLRLYINNVQPDMLEKHPDILERWPELKEKSRGSSSARR